MTEGIREWLLGITCAAMVLALAETLAPEGGPRRVCRLAGGVVLLLAAISPLNGLDTDGVTAAFTQYEAMTADYAAQLEADSGALYKSIIMSRLSEYILDKAQDMGVACRVELTLERDGQGAYVPVRVDLYGAWTQQTQQRMEAVLEEELGVPRTMQSFEKEPP